MPINNQTIIIGTANQVLANTTTAVPQGGLVTLSLPQSIGTSSSPSFSTVTSTVITGTPPFSVTSTTPVTNLSIGGTAANSSNTLVTTSTTNAVYPITLAPTSSTGQQSLLMDIDLTYNPSTNHLAMLADGLLSMGTLTYPPANAFVTLENSAATYVQLIIQNDNGGAAASADIVVNNDISSDTVFYGDFGMNSSTFTGTGSLSQPSMVYLTAASTDLSIGTLNSNPIHFVINSGTTDAFTIGTLGQWGIAGSDGTAGQVFTSGGAGAPAAWASLSGVAVTSFSAGLTGLTPSTPQVGAISLAGTLNADYGGTGQNVYVIGDILYASTTTALSRLADVASGSYLRSGGIGNAPLWSTTKLPNSATVGDLMIATTANTYTNLADVSVGSYLRSGGVGTAPLWSTLVLPNATTTGDLLYGSASNTVGNLADVAVGSYLRSGGVGVAPLWSTTLLPNSATIGDLMIATVANTYTNLADVATGNALISGGVGVAPSWNKIGLTTHVTGTLPIANGGTNSSTALSGSSIIISNGTSIIQGDAGTTTTVLHGNAAGSPSYGAVSLTADISGILAATNGGTGQSVYAVGDILYAGTTTTLSTLADVAAGSYLRSGGVTTAPLWSTLVLPNVATTGDILYASATNTVGVLADVAAGSYLRSGGVTTAPLWSTTLLPNSATIGDIMIATVANTYTNLADVATGNALISGGVGVAPSWNKIGLTTHVTGTLPIANGGTNSSTALSGNTIMISNGTSVVQGAAGTTTTVLHGNAAGSPSYSAVSLTADITGVLAATTGGTGQSVYTIGDILYASTTTALSKLAIGSTNAVLTVAAGIPAWSAGLLSITSAKTLTVTNSLTLSGTDSTTMTFPPASASIGYINIPQNSQSAAYTTVLADSGKHIYHPVGDANVRTFTIDSNANVAYALGTTITFINRSPNAVTIAITSDVLTYSPSGGTGSRTLAQYGVATAIKITTTEWIITGTGLT